MEPVCLEKGTKSMGYQKICMVADVSSYPVAEEGAREKGFSTLQTGPNINAYSEYSPVLFLTDSTSEINHVLSPAVTPLRKG